MNYTNLTMINPNIIYIAIGTITHIITEYFTYSPKKQIKR